MGTTRTMQSRWQLFGYAPNIMPICTSTGANKREWRRMLDRDLMDTGDTVYHEPSGEQWIVAYADRVRGRLAWLGWPNGEAALCDCTVVRKAGHWERDELLRRLAALPDHDARGIYARQRLASAIRETLAWAGCSACKERQYQCIKGDERGR